MPTIVLGVVVFTVMILTLVLALVLLKTFLTSGDLVRITVNADAEHPLEVGFGTTLLTALAEHGIHVPSACGGKGTCGACKLSVPQGGGAPLPTEAALLSRSEARRHVRLACQLRVKNDLAVDVPEAILGIRSYRYRVVSARNVASFIREILLEPSGEAAMNFEAGAYVQLHVPPHHIQYQNFEIEARYRADWDRYGLWKLESEVADGQLVQRAYSIATAPHEGRGIMLNVRVATPPADAPAAPTGKASSYLFSLKAGDAVELSGPYGDFRAQDSAREMVFIGGGAGMAPLRSIIVDQLGRLHTSRTISFWYGARGLLEAFYVDEFAALDKAHENFRWHLALSAPQPEDDWQGDVGNIHEVLYDRYLKAHPAPEEAEYYLCGPPRMLAACLGMLDELGVPRENVRYDEF